MKRAGQLYTLIANEASLLAAYKQACIGKRSHRAAFEFYKNLGGNIANLLAELRTGSYTPKPCNRFWVNERKKARLIEAPAFRDLVVQHAVYAAIAPVLERKYIDTSFACRIGKGTHKAADWAQQMMRFAPRTAWTLHVDVRKFFYSIDRQTLRALLARHIKCQRTLGLLALFSHRPESTGIPIGNLLSQTFANVYLNSLDQFCKRSLALKWYGRYMDDSVMLVSSRLHGLEVLTQINAHLVALGLSISHHSLQPIKRGINFVGYRTWASARFVRQSLVSAIRSDARHGRLAPLVSRLGCALRTCSHTPLVLYIQEHHHAIFDCLPKSHFPRHNHCASPAA